MVKGRAKKANAARRGKQPGRVVTDKRATALPKKLDSRAEACGKYKVSTRTYRKVATLAKDRPDLYGKVLDGTLPVIAALKRKGRNVEIDRVNEAKKLNQAAAEAAAAMLAEKTDDVNAAAGKEDLMNRIHCGEAVEVMTRVPDGAASLVLYSPDYPGVSIDYDPPLPKRTYAEWRWPPTAIADPMLPCQSDGRSFSHRRRYRPQ